MYPLDETAETVYSTLYLRLLLSIDFQYFSAMKK